MIGPRSENARADVGRNDHQECGRAWIAANHLRNELDPVLAARAARARSRRGRRRKPGAGRTPKLGPDDRLLLVVMYYRISATQVVLGGLFGVDAGTACRAIRAVGLAPVGVFRIPERKVRLGPDELAEAFVGATAPPTYRPRRGRRRYYSGKKERHTFKHQMVVVREVKRPGRGGPRKRTARIAAGSEAARGATHDRKVCDRSGLELPAGVPGVGGRGLPGDRAAGADAEAAWAAPNRPAEGRQPTAGAAAEHGIGRLKVWRIAADRYRNPRSRHTVVTKNVAGLHNRMFG